MTIRSTSIALPSAGRISVRVYSYPIAIDLAPSGPLAVVIDTYGDLVTLVNSRAHRAMRSVDSYLGAAVIAP